MKKIIYDINLFTINSPIYIADPEAGKVDHICDVPLTSVVETISSLCAKENISQISLSGNPTYGEQLAKDIIEYSKINYSENKIEIEVI
jgi:hypothetical protein